MWGREKGAVQALEKSVNFRDKIYERVRRVGEFLRTGFLERTYDACHAHETDYNETLLVTACI